MQYLRKVWAGIRAVLARRFGISTWADLRNIIHLMAPSIAGFLVTWNLLEPDRAKLIGALIAAVTSPLLSLPNSTDKVRSYIFGVLAAGQGVLMGFGLTGDQVTPIVGVALALLGGMLSSTNTPTSQAGVQGKPGRAGLES